MKRKSKRAEQRAKAKAAKLAGIGKPSGKGRYGKKNRKAEIARGYSTRPMSPFYLPPAVVESTSGAS